MSSMYSLASTLRDFFTFADWGVIELENRLLKSEAEELKQDLLEKDAEIASLKAGQLSFPFTFRT